MGYLEKSRIRDTHDIERTVSNQSEALYAIQRSRYVILFCKKMYVTNPKKETYTPGDLMPYCSEIKLITYALRRLHTNPSDWIKKIFSAFLRMNSNSYIIVRF